MAALPDKIRMAESKEDDNVILPQPEDNVISSSFAENKHSETSEKLDDITALENKQPKSVVDKQKGVKEELQGKNIQDEKCDYGKNYGTFLKASVVTID